MKASVSKATRGVRSSLPSKQPLCLSVSSPRSIMCPKFSLRDVVKILMAVNKSLKNVMGLDISKGAS